MTDNVIQFPRRGVVACPDCGEDAMYTPGEIEIVQVVRGINPHAGDGEIQRAFDRAGVHPDNLVACCPDCDLFIEVRVK